MDKRIPFDPEDENHTRAYWPNGQLRTEIKYLNMKKDGTHIEFDGNGKKSYEYNYKDGKLHGIYCEWHRWNAVNSDTSKPLIEENGIMVPLCALKLKCNYVDDKKEGDETTWYPDGKLESRKIYKNNEPVNIKTYYENGNIWWEENYHGLEIFPHLAINGYKKENPDHRNMFTNQKHGICKYWYPNGELQSEGTYIDGKLDGYCKKYYESGNIELEVRYKMGVKEDVRRYSDEKSRVQKEIEFKAMQKKIQEYEELLARINNPPAGIVIPVLDKKPPPYE